MSARTVGWTLGCILLALALALLLPALVAVGYGEDEALEGSLWACFTTAAVGALLCVACRADSRRRGRRADLSRREVLGVVGLAWVVVPMFAALPYLYTGAIARPVDALFEATSGLTTTGATILSVASFDDPATETVREGIARSLLFWRALSQWLGGLGIVLAFVLFLPGGSDQSGRVASSAHRRPTGQRVRESASALVRVYTVLTVILGASLWALTRHPFESALTALSTLSSGGFSVRGDGLVFDDSLWVQVVLVVFMLLAGVHFHVLETLYRRGWRAAWEAARRAPEVRAYLWLWIFCTVSVGLVLWSWGGSNGVAGSPLPNYASFGRSLGNAAFAAASAGSTTGAVARDTDQWPAVCRLLLLALAGVGACSGSTGGGLKVGRLLLLLRAAGQRIRQTARPRAITSLRLGGVPVDEGALAHALGVVGVWGLTWGVGTLLVAALLTGLPGGDESVLVTAASAALACLSNAGHGLAAVGPGHDYGFFPDLAKLLLALLMVLGRLEVLLLCALLTPRFWRT